MATTLPPNFQHLGSSFYLVRTQAGFTQALKNWDESWLLPLAGTADRKGEVKDLLRGFPKSYPSIVSFSYGYEGYVYVRANCMPVNKIKDAIMAT